MINLIPLILLGFLLILPLIINGLALRKLKKSVSENHFCIPPLWAIWAYIIVVFVFLNAFSNLFEPYSIAQQRTELLLYFLYLIISLGTLYSLLILLRKQLFSSIKIKSFIIRGYQLAVLIFIIVFIFLPPYLLQQHYNKQSLAMAPPAFQIKKVIYGYHTFTGIGGPSDQFSGLSVYLLPDSIMHQINHGGMAFLNQLPIEQGCDSWQKSPLLNDDGIAKKLCTLCLFGDSDASDHALQEADKLTTIEAKINELLVQSDNYYCHTGKNILLISPKDQWLIVHYYE